MKAKSTDSQWKQQTMFVVWGSPAIGPRSIALARALEIGPVCFVQAGSRRGFLSAPLRYLVQTLKTLCLLFRRRPRLILVQNPPSPAVMVTCFYCALTGSRYVVDSHSAAFALAWWTRPRFLYAALARRALATLVTNDDYATQVRNWGGIAMVLPDIPGRRAIETTSRLDAHFAVAVVNTFSVDEPLETVIGAAAELPEVQFYITGRIPKKERFRVDSAPKNVHFTDYLSENRYFELLAACDVVVCLTTRDRTMQRGACEALALGKPIITSDWPLLVKYFNRGAIHVKAEVGEIGRAIERIRSSYAHFQSEILELRELRHAELSSRMKELLNLLGQPISVSPGRNNACLESQR